MKKSTLILGIAALLSVAFLAVSCNTTGNQTNEDKEETPSMKGAIVFFNLDTVTQEYDMANDLRSVVETKINSISDEVNRKGNKLQKDVNAFQEKIDKGLMTRSVAEVQSQKLQKQQADFQNWFLGTPRGAVPDIRLLYFFQTLGTRWNSSSDH